MKIKVVHKDHSVETLTIPGPVIIIEGDVKKGHTFNRIEAADGMDHYFRQDGFYDGWGRGLPLGSQEGDASRLLDTIELTRDIKGQGEGDG